MEVHDFVAVGLGPANLGLACLTEPIDGLEGVFLESRDAFDWHPGMLLEHATLQTPFLADLVTMADPTSSYGFLNYLKQVGRLYPFYIRENFFPLRAEYNDYCRWAAARLSTVRFGHHVERVEYDAARGVYRVGARTADGGTTVCGRRLVLGTGTVPDVPPAARGLGGDAVHSADYLPHKAALQAKDRVVVVGSGQSAAEVFADLLADADHAGRELVWVTRSARFFPLEYTKLTLEMTSPEYTDYFHALAPDVRDGLLDGQKGLYQGISAGTVDAIYDLLYTKSRTGARPARLLTSTALTGAAHDPETGTYTLELHQTEQDRTTTLTTDGLVLATGYRPEIPAFLDPVADRLALDERGRLDVRRDYTVSPPDAAGAEILVQNAEAHTHGFVAPDLGMMSYRNSWLIRTMLGREYYPVERSIAFQEFGLAPESGVRT